MNFPKLKLKDDKTLGLFASHNVSIFRNIFRANRKGGSRIGVYKMFPTSSSQAKRPQRIVKGPER